MTHAHRTPLFILAAALGAIGDARDKLRELRDRVTDNGPTWRAESDAHERLYRMANEAEQGAYADRDREKARADKATRHVAEIHALIADAPFYARVIANMKLPAVSPLMMRVAAERKELAATQIKLDELEAAARKWPSWDATIRPVDAVGRVIEHLASARAATKAIVDMLAADPHCKTGDDARWLTPAEQLAHVLAGWKADRDEARAAANARAQECDRGKARAAEAERAPICMWSSEPSTASSTPR